MQVWEVHQRSKRDLGYKNKRALSPLVKRHSALTAACMCRTKQHMQTNPIKIQFN